MKKLLTLIAILYSFSANTQSNKVVLITGASRGVGLATAEFLAENGFTVYGTVRDALPIAKQNIHFLALDLLDANAIHKAVQAILDQENRIDILINNAGYALVGPVESLSEEEMHHQMEVNFFAPIRLIQAVLPSMRDQGSGHIINISSPNAFQPPPFGSLYSASKAALEAFSEALSVEVQPHKISVSIIEPGLIQTHFALPMGTKEIPNNPYRSITENICTAIQERLAHPERLSPSQTPKEIAEFLFGVIQDSHPKLRYQTSEDAKQCISKKLLDLTGEIYLEEMRSN